MEDHDMNILEMMLSAGNGGAVSEVGRQFGLDERQVQNVMGQLVPALSGGIKRNLSQPQGLDDLMGALQRQDHERYLDQPDLLARDETRADGNAILGHIFGSTEVSREVAERTARTTGVDSTLLKKMLPVVAALVMGSLNKGAKASGSLSEGSAPGGADLLGSLLDADGDGSVVDDLIGMAGRFLR